MLPFFMANFDIFLSIILKQLFIYLNGLHVAFFYGRL
jgi:hypothetical protein